MVWLQAHKDHIRHLWRLQHYSMENGQDTALGDGAVDDWEICVTWGFRIKTRWRASKARYSGACEWGISKCAGRWYRQAITQSKCSSNLEKSKGHFPWSFSEGRCFASQGPPHGRADSVVLSLSPVTLVGISALFGAPAPQWAWTPSPPIPAVGALPANDAVVQSCLTVGTPRPALPAER